MVLTLLTKYFLDFPACGTMLDFTFSCIWKHAGQMANSIGVGVCLFFFLSFSPYKNNNTLCSWMCPPLAQSPLLYLRNDTHPCPVLLLHTKSEDTTFWKKVPLPLLLSTVPLLSVPLDSKTKSCSLAADWWFLLFCNSLPVVDTRVFKFGILPAT